MLLIKIQARLIPRTYGLGHCWSLSSVRDCSQGYARSPTYTATTVSQLLLRCNVGFYLQMNGCRQLVHMPHTVMVCNHFMCSTWWPTPVCWGFASYHHLCWSYIAYVADNRTGALDPYNNHRIMPLADFIEHPLAHELVHNGQTLQVYIQPHLHLALFSCIAGVQSDFCTSNICCNLL